MTCVTAHALLSALVARLRAGGPDARADELRAIVASGCPRRDLEAALAAGDGAIARARELLAATDTPERRRA